MTNKQITRPDLQALSLPILRVSQVLFWILSFQLLLYPFFIEVTVYDQFFYVIALIIGLISTLVGRKINFIEIIDNYFNVVSMSGKIEKINIRKFAKIKSVFFYFYVVVFSDGKKKYYMLSSDTVIYYIFARFNNQSYCDELNKIIHDYIERYYS